MQGGIRLPQFLVPTADQGALNGTLFPCNVSGWHRYYTDAELKAMYRNHGGYVSKVTKSSLLWLNKATCSRPTRKRPFATRRSSTVGK